MVVETEASPSKGERLDVLSYDPESAYFGDPLVRGYTRVAYALRCEGEGGGFASSGTFAQLAEQIPPEQLAYASSLAVGADVVSGDRSKEVTFERLLHGKTAVELDACFGNQAERAVQSLLGRKGGGFAPSGVGDAFEEVVIHERNAILCHSIRGKHPLSLSFITLTEIDARACSDVARMYGDPAHIVAVVGEDHVSGVKEMWKGGEWGDITSLMARPEPIATTVRPAFVGGGAERGEQSDSCEEASQGERALKRAIVEAVLRLRCPAELQERAAKSLEEVPPEHVEAYKDAFEVGGLRLLFLPPTARRGF